MMKHSLTYSDKNEIYSQSTQNSIEPQSYAHPRRINFLICRLCFWCASYLYGAYKAAVMCPMCDNNSIESIPISDKEAFEFGYSQLRRVILNFFQFIKSLQMPNILRIARKGMTLNDDSDYTKINRRIIDLLENNGFQVDMNPARHILLKLVIGSYKVKAVTQDLTNKQLGELLITDIERSLKMEFADRTVKEIMEAIPNIVKHNLTSEGKVYQSNDC